MDFFFDRLRIKSFNCLAVVIKFFPQNDSFCYWHGSFFNFKSKSIHWILWSPIMFKIKLLITETCINPVFMQVSSKQSTYFATSQLQYYKHRFSLDFMVTYPIITKLFKMIHCCHIFFLTYLTLPPWCLRHHSVQKFCLDFAKSHSHQSALQYGHSFQP